MDDPLRVGVRHRVGDVADDLEGPPRGKPLLHEDVERLPLDVVHRVVVLLPHRPDVVDGDDVRVAQARDDLRLADEALALFVVGRGPREDHLHREDAIEADGADLVDDPHPAARDLAEDLVLAERLRIGAEPLAPELGRPSEGRRGDRRTRGVQGERRAA